MLELVRTLSGSPRGERFARRLWRATGGNPLFTFETLAHLVETGVLGIDASGRWATPFDDATEDYRELPIPPSVHAALAARVRSLGEAAQRLLEAASLIGDDFDLALATSASALGEWEALRALEAALAARLVRRREASGALFRFEHDLVAQTLQAAMAPERRALVHRALVAPLAQRGAPPARIAEHAERGGDPAAARRWRLLALDAARRRFALADVIAEAERVLALDPSPPQAIAAHLARAAALRQRADRPGAEAALGDAGRLLAEVDELSLHVAVMQERGVLAALSGTPGSLDDELGRLLADPRLDDADRARLLTTRGECRRVAGRLAEAEADLGRALTALDADDDEERGLLIERLARSVMLRGDCDTALAQAGQAVALLERVGHPPGLARAWTLVGLTEIHLGRPAEAVKALTRSRAIAADAGMVHLERAAILNLIPVLHQLGDYEQAMRLVDEGLALSPLFTSPNEAQAFVEASHVCRCIAGDLGGALDAWAELVRHTEKAGEAHRQRSGWLVAADLPLLLGDVATARTVLERARARGGEIRRLSVQTHAKAGWLALLRGDVAAATAELEAGQRIGESAPDELAYLKTLELRLRRAGGRPSFGEDAIRVTREGATAEVWASMLAATIDWQHARGAVAPADVEAAFTELESGKVPPLNLLDLLAALDGAGCLEQGPRAVWHQRGRALAARLHASLSRHPRERALFDRRHARWLTPPG
jgi:tetratricopeptide (TPR) repeat protein